MRLLSFLFPIRGNLLTPVWRSIRTIEEIQNLKHESSLSNSLDFRWIIVGFQTMTNLVHEALNSNGQGSSVLELSSENYMELWNENQLWILLSW